MPDTKHSPDADADHEVSDQIKQLEQTVLLAQARDRLDELDIIIPDVRYLVIENVAHVGEVIEPSHYDAICEADHRVNAGASNADTIIVSSPLYSLGDSPAWCDECRTLLAARICTELGPPKRP